MTFVLVGAGPTGVELAASIAQMTTTTLRSNFRRINPANTSIFLLEGGKRVLPSFAESLAEKAAARLGKLGVKVVTGAMVEHIDERGVIVGGKRIESSTVLWTAGVSPSPLVKMLGVATDRAGRACVSPHLNLPDSRRVFVVGDAGTLMQDGKPLPGVAQVAIQQGRYVGRLLAEEIRGGTAPRPFRYFDKGNIAVVGKNFAVMESGRIRLAGLPPGSFGLSSTCCSCHSYRIVGAFKTNGFGATSPGSAARVWLLKHRAWARSSGGSRGRSRYRQQPDRVFDPRAELSMNRSIANSARSSEQLTTTAGNPIADNQNSLSAGPRGPLLLQDYQLLEKLAHQNRERIPERPVHAKGWGTAEVHLPRLAHQGDLEKSELR